MAEQPSFAGASTRACGVLVVDDEEAIGHLLERGLRACRFAVWQATSGPEALELYRCYGPGIDVALLDVRMPGMDGPQTLAALRRLEPRLRCCFMSGHSGAYTDEELRRLGAAHFFAKPFRLAEVARVLEQVVSDPS